MWPAFGISRATGQLSVREASLEGARSAPPSLMTRGGRVDAFQLPRTDYRMFECVVTANGRRRSTRITQGYLHLIAEWVLGGRRGGRQSACSDACHKHAMARRPVSSRCGIPALANRHRECSLISLFSVRTARTIDKTASTRLQAIFDAALGERSRSKPASQRIRPGRCRARQSSPAVARARARSRRHRGR
jgi:hypothetical protein